MYAWSVSVMIYEGHKLVHFPSLLSLSSYNFVNLLSASVNAKIKSCELVKEWPVECTLCSGNRITAADKYS